MAIIYNYPLNSILLAEDMLIGTSTNIVNGQPKNATKNFSIADLTGFIKGNVSLNDVLLVGNTSLLDAKVGGLYLYDTPVTDYGNIVLNQNRFSFNTITHGEVFRAQRDMFSSFSSSGYRGSFEVSSITANRVWDFPNKSGTVALLSDATPTLQEVTDEGNTITTELSVITLGEDSVTVTNAIVPSISASILNEGFFANDVDKTSIYTSNKIVYADLATYKNLQISYPTSIVGTNKTQVFQDASGTLALTSNIGTWGALNYPVWTTGTPFVKMTAAGTFALDTNTYLTSITSSDVTTALGYTPVTNARTLTINGVGYDLTADRSWTISSLPSQTGNNGKFLTTDGTIATWATIPLPTPAALTKTDDTNVTLTLGGSPSAALLAATSLTLGWTGTLADSRIASATTWNAKQNALSGTGVVKSTAGTISYINGLSSEFVKGDGSLDSNTYLTTAVTSVDLTMPSAFNVTGNPITTSGTIAVTGAGLVSQYVRGDGTLANFPNSTGGGSSVNYYLNGSVSQGTFGGTTYYQMSKTPILGAGTNFTRTNGQGNGYIASFITDAGDPSFLNIPSGNWNLEFYFQSSASGGSPQFYGEIYKVSATNVFTLVASGVSNPEGITNGTTVDQYFTSIPVPQTSLLITDRLAIRIYVITSGKTITLHTENGNLSEVLTTFTTGLTALNGLTQQVQNLAVGTSGTDFAISSATDTHTFNLPTASATNRGALSSADWSTFNSKQNALSYTPYRFTAPSQIVHTGVVTETILQTILIPANTFSNGDFIMFSALVSKLANIGNTTHNLKINTTNTLVGATSITLLGFNTTNFSMKFKREMIVNGGNIYVLNVSAGTTNDQVTSATASAINSYTYNLAADLYFFVTCQLANVLDTITYRGINFYKQ